MTEKTLATVRLFVAGIIEILGVWGFTMPISENTAVAILMAAVMAATFIYTWWKNSNVSVAAEQAQVLLDEMKANNVDVIAAVKEIIEVTKGEDNANKVA